MAPRRDTEHAKPNWRTTLWRSQLKYWLLAAIILQAIMLVVPLVASLA